MTIAEFEEREYERPLYHELRVTNNRLWSPGQVLETRVGFDAALLTLDPFLFSIYGVAPTPGVRLSRYWRFMRHTLNVPARRRLPTFLLNVFIQAKRPRHLKTASRAIAANGVRGAHWAFTIDTEQQLVLEKLEAKFQGRALVTYAAPLFHTEQLLYRHTIDGTTATNSTFPAPSKLSGHVHWHYKVPGAVGVASSEPEGIEDLPLEARLANLGGHQDPPETPPQQGGGDDGWLENLRSLSAGIREVMEDDALPETFRRSQYFIRLQEITADTEAFAEAFPWC